MSYHVFLSHNSEDKPIVRALYDWLERHGVECFLDENDLEPGDVLTDALGEAMEASQSAIICIGPHGEGPWHGEEMNTLLSRSLRMARTSNEFRLIPVLLPEADTSKMRWFLQTRLWVDLSKGLTGAEAELERLRAAILGERGMPVVQDPGFNPYRGLEAFRREDAAAFFGRTKESAELAAKLKQSRFCVISGASGSGKSSLARAGLGTDAALKVCPDLPLWKQVTVKPGQGFLRALLLQLHANLPAHERGPLVESAIAALMPPSGLPSPEKWAEAVDQHLQNFFPDDDETVLLLVDQFEEIFTHRGIGSTTDKDRMDRARLVLDGLAMLRAQGSRRWRILITMRSDFYQRCRISPDFWGLLEKDHLTLELDELSEDGWREAIKNPASRAGAYLEAGLVEIMLKDVYRQRGSMPLLQLALQSLWQLRDGACLTHAAYTTIGGVANALQQRAESCLKTLGDESPELLQIARNLLLRLVSPGEGVSDTRRRADRRELEWENTVAADLDRVVNELTSPENRLLMTDGDSVEVVHEVLIRDCAKIRGWIELSRGELPILRRLTHSARSWEDSGREPVFLNPADPPRELKLWIKKTTLRVTPLEREFWKTSRVERRQLHLDKRSARKRLKEEQEQRLKTVEAARVAAVLAEGQLRQRSRIAMAVAAVAFAAAGTAIFYWHAAGTAKGKAERATGEALGAKAKAQTAADSALKQRDAAHRALADAFYHRLRGAGPQLARAEEDAMWELTELTPENDSVRALLMDKWLNGTGEIRRFAAYDFAAMRSAGALRQMSGLAPRMAATGIVALQSEVDSDASAVMQALPPTAFDAAFAGRVLEAILADATRPSRITELSAVLRALPPTAFDAAFAGRVLEAILSEATDFRRIEALSGVVKALPPTALDPAFAGKVLGAILGAPTVSTMDDLRINALSAVLWVFPPTAFDAAFAGKVLEAILSEATDYDRIYALSSIVKVVPVAAFDAAFAENVLHAILSEATDYNRICAHAGVLEALPSSEVDATFAGKVLEAILSNSVKSDQISALSRVVKVLPTTTFDAAFGGKVLERILSESTEPDRIEDFAGVLKALPSTAFDAAFARKALAALFAKGTDESRRSVLSAVLPTLPSPVLDAAFAGKVLEAILSETSDPRRIKALFGAFRAFPSTAINAAFAGKVLEVILSETTDVGRIEALFGVVKVLPATAFDAAFAGKVLEALFAKGTDESRKSALFAVLQTLPSPVLDAAFAGKVLEAILSETRDPVRIDALFEAVKTFPSTAINAEFAGEVLELILSKPRDYGRITTLSNFIKAFPSTAIDAAFGGRVLEAILSEKTEFVQISALSDIISSHPTIAVDAALAGKVLEAILSEATDSDRISALSGVLETLTPSAFDAAFAGQVLEVLTKGQRDDDHREVLYKALLRASAVGIGFPAKLRLWAFDHLLRKGFDGADGESRRKKAVAVCSKLADTDPALLVDVLKWPICYGERQKLVLEAIENAPKFKGFKAEDVKFNGNLFTFVEKAPSLGFTNLDTPPVRPTLEAAVAEWKEWIKTQRATAGEKK